jgi:eukaryotic-like serine/threonine-protein kinase
MAFRGTKRFELIRKLGEGGEGLVYEAHDNERDMRVALKTLRELDATNLYRFKKEFRALNDVSHPNIVGLYDLVSERDDWFFTMELVEGVDLISYVRPAGWRAPAAAASERSTAAIARVLVASGGGGGNGVVRAPLDQPRVPLTTLADEARLRNALGQLAQALQALHDAGMVHRDLKPSNVRVTPKGRVVLVDFGIAAEASVLGDQPEGTVSGTPAFMAPEQAAGEMPTAAADWYSFGVLMYLALTGQLPFAGTPELVLVAKQNEEAVSAAGLTEGVPDDLANLSAALLQRRAGDRPSGTEVLARLGLVAEDHTLTGAESSRSAFVGRQEELAALHDAYAAAAGGTTVSVFVRGVSGMGKSALMRRFLAEIDADPARPIVLKGRCHERESLPYKAFDDVIDRLSHLLISLPAEEVHGLLPDDADLLPRLFPVLRRVPGIQRAQALNISDPHEMRERAFAALAVLLAKLARRKPLVVYIDDLQWADRDSLLLLVELFRNPSPPVMLFVGALRAENLAGDEDGRLHTAIAAVAARHLVREIDLGPLSPADQRALVARLLASGTAPADALGDDFWSQSSGSPLFLSEMARFAREHGALPAGDRPSLEHVIYSRIEQLPPIAFTLIEMVAVAGEPTPLWILGDACGLAPDDRERALGILRVVNLVRVARYAGEPWLAPYHDRVRETLQTRMPEERQRRLHRQLAEVLERWDQATVDGLARHWLAAGDPKQAVTYLVKAARGAADKLAFDRAAELYRVALESGAVAAEARRDLMRARGEALALAGRGYEAAGEYRRAAEGAEPEVAVDLVRRAADELLRGGRLVEGMDAMREVMRSIGWRAAESRRGILASLIWQRARLGLRGLGYKPRREIEVPAQELARLDTLYAAASALGMIDNLRGADVQTRHLRTALAVGEEKRVVRALAIDVVYRAAAGGKRNLAKAQALARDVELKARRIGDPMLIAISKLAVGGALFFSGDYRQTAQAFQEAEQLLAPMVGVEWERTTARYFRCYSRIQMGDYVAAVRDVEAMLADAERRNDLYARSLFGTSAGIWSLLIRDDVEGAVRRLASGLEGWPSEPFLLIHYMELTAGAAIDLYRGDAKAALERLDAGMPRLRSSVLSKMPWVMADVRRCYVAAATILGKLELARRWLMPLADIDAAITRGYVAAYEGIFALRGGRNDDGERRLVEAIHHFDVADTPQLSSATRFQLGRRLGGTEGERMTAEALAWMRTAGVAQPERMIDLLLPPV